MKDNRNNKVRKQGSKSVSPIADPQNPVVKESALRGAAKIFLGAASVLGAGGRQLTDEEINYLNMAYFVVKFYDKRLGKDDFHITAAILNCLRFT